MTRYQLPLFPDEMLPRIIEIFPSVIARWFTLQDVRARQDALYLSGMALRVYGRIEHWSSSNDLLENPTFVSLWFTFWNALEAYTMAGRKATTQGYQKPEWKGFVERVLSEDELAQCDEWKPKPAEIIEAMCALSQAGYDLKISYNAAKEQGNATLVDQRAKLPTTGYALSARGTNCADALKILVYKHYHLLGGDWSTLLSQTPRTKRG